MAWVNMHCPAHTLLMLVPQIPRGWYLELPEFRCFHFRVAGISISGLLVVRAQSPQYFHPRVGSISISELLVFPCQQASLDGGKQCGDGPLLQRFRVKGCVSKPAKKIWSVKCKMIFQRILSKRKTFRSETVQRCMPCWHFGRGWR